MRDGRASFEPYMEVLRSLPFARRVRVLALAPRWAGTALDATIEVETAAGRFRLPCERTAAHLQREVAARPVPPQGPSLVEEPHSGVEAAPIPGQVGPTAFGRTCPMPAAGS